MLFEILKSENIGGTFAEIEETIRQGIPSAVFNAPFSVKCHIAANAPGFALYICKDVLSLDKAAAEISALSGGRSPSFTRKTTCCFITKRYPNIRFSKDSTDCMT